MFHSSPTHWLLFLANLAGRSASTPRVRLWRALKELGAGTLRDGAAVLPACEEARRGLETIRGQVEADGGNAWLLELGAQSADVDAAIRALFDRGAAYREVGDAADALRRELASLDEAAARRRLRQLERDIASVERVDFFPGAGAAYARERVTELAGRIDRHFSPDEPIATGGEITPLDRRHYQGRTWATRRRPWVDRVASAWLIRRYVDQKARFLWLETPADCPSDALGFDFDGAAFTHVGARVTFEVLMASFALDTEPGLDGIARLVHYLDVGGEPVEEAAGFEAILAGLRDVADDDALLDAMTPVLEALRRRYAAAVA